MIALILFICNFLIKWKNYKHYKKTCQDFLQRSWDVFTFVPSTHWPIPNTASQKNNLAHYEVGSSSSSIRNRSVCRWNKRENFPAPLQEILTGFLVVLYVVVVVCVDNARPLFFAKSFYKLHHRRHTDTAASKLSTGSKQVINNNEIGKNNIWCCFTTFFILGVGMPSE